MRETPTEEDIAKALHLKQEEISSLQASKCVDTLEAKAQEALSVGKLEGPQRHISLIDLRPSFVS
jgi:hypothetical protein